jgi:hypothetical protein
MTGWGVSMIPLLLAAASRGGDGVKFPRSRAMFSRLARALCEGDLYKPKARAHNIGRMPPQLTEAAWLPGDRCRPPLKQKLRVIAQQVADIDMPVDTMPVDTMPVDTMPVDTRLSWSCARQASIALPRARPGLATALWLAVTASPSFWPRATGVSRRPLLQAHTAAAALLAWNSGAGGGPAARTKHHQGRAPCKSDARALGRGACSVGQRPDSYSLVTMLSPSATNQEQAHAGAAACSATFIRSPGPAPRLRFCRTARAN